MQTLILYAFSTNLLSYYDDWLEAFQEHPAFDVTATNVWKNPGNPHLTMKAAISTADLIVLHHSMTADTLKFLLPLAPFLKDRKGKLVSFVGNEVNLPTLGMAPKIQILKEIEADIIATQLLEETGKWLYSECKKSQVISLPHALNPKKFYKTNSYKQRSIDIGTRSARYGVYIGDNDRNTISSFFHKNQQNFGIVTDLGMEENSKPRFNREEWRIFLNTCKGMISTEAGSFYLEKDDKTINKIVAYLKAKRKVYVIPSEFIGNVGQYIPDFFKKTVRRLTKKFILEAHRIDEDVEFEEIRSLFFNEHNKCPLYSKAISSRHFDSIGTQTLNIMFPGRYNDILTPYKHYFPLQKDFSNVDDLMSLLKEESEIEKIIREAHTFVRENHTHHERLNNLLRFLS